MEKKSLRITVAAVAVVIVVVAAGAFVMLRSQDDDTIKIGVLPTIDTLPLYVAQEQGLFEKEGVNVKLVQFNSAAELDAAFTAGQIDGYFSDIVNTLVLKSTGQDVKVVTVDYHTQEDYTMFALLASSQSGITSISQISGESIANSAASVTEYFMDEILKADSISNVSLNSMPQIPLRFQSLISGQVRLALLPQPFVQQAIDEGAKMIANDTSLDTTSSVIAFRGSLISEDLNLMKGFLSAYNESVALVNQDPTEGQYADILEKEIHFPGGLMGTFLFPTMSAPSLPSQKDVVRVQGWMEEKGMLTSPIPYESIMATELYA